MKAIIISGLLGLLFYFIVLGVCRIYINDEVAMDKLHLRNCIAAFAESCALMTTTAEQAECVVANRYSCFDDR